MPARDAPNCRCKETLSARSELPRPPLHQLKFLPAAVAGTARPRAACPSTLRSMQDDLGRGLAEAAWVDARFNFQWLVGHRETQKRCRPTHISSSHSSLFTKQPTKQQDTMSMKCNRVIMT